MQGKHFPVPISWHGFILILACLDLVSSGEVSWIWNCIYICHIYFFNVPNYQCWCLLIYQQNGLAEKVIYAINSGGEAHVDTYGIRYQRDPLRSVGTASDYGKQLLIGMRHSTLLKFSLRSNSYALLKRFWTINSYRKSSRRRPNSLSNGAIPYIYIWIWYTCLRRWLVSSRIEIQWSLLQCT